MFLKISLGTIVGLHFATKGWAADTDTAPGLGPAILEPPYFSQENFPDSLERKPGQFLHRDPTRLLLTFKVRQTPAALQSFLNASHLVLEEPSPKGSPFKERINNSHRNFWVRKDQPDDQNSPIDQETYSYLAQQLGNTLDWVGPVYARPGAIGRRGRFCAPPHILLLKFHGDIGSTLPPSIAQTLTAAHLREVPRKSLFLNNYRYFELEVPDNGTVFHFYRLVREGKVPFVEDAKLDGIPLVKTSAVGCSPNDALYGSENTGQWNLRHIHADTGWTLSTGSNKVVIWVIDTGFDSIDRSTIDGKGPHPDITFVHHGIDLYTMKEILPDDWFNLSEEDVAHGTACAGIAAAITNNKMMMGVSGDGGVAGVAGGCFPPTGCGIYPLFWRLDQGTSVAHAFNLAAKIQLGLLPSSDPAFIPVPPGGSVMSISHGDPWNTMTWESEGAWDSDLIDPAIKTAHDADIVICASSGNDDAGDATNPPRAGITYPAINPFVIACGASDKTDRRVTKATATWGSNYGAQLSVVAPGITIPTTDLQDFPGENTPVFATGDYVANFWGTSASAPHVAGLAALLRSRYPLSAKQVQDIIERTAQKTGSIPYSELAGKPNGTWNTEMGYGLIDTFKALNFADIMIKDHPSDDGTEPFLLPTPTYMFDQSDVVVRPVNDVTLGNFSAWATVAAGKTLTDNNNDNFLFVRVINNGPNSATNVIVTVRLVSKSVLPAQYPHDWTATMNNSNRRIPQPPFQPIPLIAANTSTIVTFRIAPSDIQWVKNTWGGYSFVLAGVMSDNDYAFQTASTTGGMLISRRNNLTIAPLQVSSPGGGSGSPGTGGGNDSTAPSPPTNLRVQ